MKRIIIGSFILFFLLMHFFFFRSFYNQKPCIVDEQHYNTLALSILERGEFGRVPGKPTAIRPPLYPAFLALVYKIFGPENYNAVRVIQVLLSLLSGLLVYSLAQKIFREERVALLAAALFLFYPTLVIFNYLILTETLFIFLFLLALWFLLAGIERSLWDSKDCFGHLRGLAMTKREERDLGMTKGYSERSEAIPLLSASEGSKIATGPSVPRDDKGEAGARNDEIAAAAVRPRDDSLFVIASERERAKQSLSLVEQGISEGRVPAGPHNDSCPVIASKAKQSQGSPRPLARPRDDKMGAWLLLLLAGVFWGLASLTRSVTYPLTPLVGLFLILIWPKKRQGLIAAAIFVTAVVLTLSPWMVRNYRVFGHFVAVDTMGGLNLYMGNYEHTPLHRAWAAVDNPPDIAWYRGHEKELQGLNEAEKQRWAIKKALEFIKEHPGLTALRTLIKTANFWQLERSIIAGMQKGYFPGFRNKLVKILIALSVLSVYIFIVIFGFSGLLWSLKWRMPNGEWSLQGGSLELTKQSQRYIDWLIVLLVFYFTAIHAIVFGHSRYHLPLIPLLCMYAAYFLLHLREIWQNQRRYFWRIFVPVCLIFGGFWAYDVFIGSKDKILTFLRVLF